MCGSGYPAPFKAAVALAALRGAASTEALARCCGVSPEVVLAWVRQLETGAAAAFQNEPDEGHAQQSAAEVRRQLLRVLAR